MPASEAEEAKMKKAKQEKLKNQLEKKLAFWERIQF
jgi:hypothetical protein